MQSKWITFLLVLIPSSIVAFNNSIQLIEAIKTNSNVFTFFLLIILLNAFYIGKLLSEGKLKWQ